MDYVRGLRLDVDSHRLLKLVAASRGVTVTEALQQAVSYLYESEFKGGLLSELDIDVPEKEHKSALKKIRSKGAKVRRKP